ncbi:MAG: HAD hydrolase family protein [Acidobacteria bacterium]|nr:HAD hydrolase family protein [Acidobacteriota bacterium]
MITVEIPGFRTFTFRHLVLDVNGTLAKDGHLIEGTVPLLKELHSKLDIHLVTADTHGKQEAINRTLSMEAVKIPVENQVKAKLDYIEKLDAESVVAVGNGANDAAMLEHAALGIAVIGPEGAAVESVLKAKIVTSDIQSALELLLFPKRLMATLRR